MAIGSFVALGDSFTEGLDDPRAGQEGYLGWADRFAGMLAGQRPGLRYANLAVRGKLLGQVAEEQLPQAIAMAPDLVSLAAGGNDLLRPRGDPDTLAELFDEVVRTLLMAGYNMHLRAIAGRHQCLLVDLWSMSVLRDPRAWSADRLHLTPDGHRRVALRTCEVLGVPATADWREPWPAAEGAASSPTRAWLAARRTDVRWARVHAAPWVARRVRGVSSGDDITP